MTLYGPGGQSQSLCACGICGEERAALPLGSHPSLCCPPFPIPLLCGESRGRKHVDGVAGGESLLTKGMI